MKTYNTGESTWVHGQKRNCSRDDWHILLGPCPICGTRTFDYGGGWRCMGDYCFNSVGNTAPSVGDTPTWWNTNVCVRKDGDSWQAHYDDFINSMESPEGWGSTPMEAVKELLG